LKETSLSFVLANKNSNDMCTLFGDNFSDYRPFLFIGQNQRREKKK